MPMFLVDDGLIAGHFDLADVFFLVAIILAVLAAVFTRPPTTSPWSSFCGFLAIAFIGAGLLVL